MYKSVKKYEQEELNLHMPITPKRFRLPLFGSTRIPGHSTRIISTANILIKCPLLAEPVDTKPIEVEPNDQVIEVIPAIGRYIALKSGYYLLDCHVNKIAGAKAVRAQKIIRRPRMLKAIPVPKPTE